MKPGHYLLGEAREVVCGSGEDEMMAGTWIEDAETIPQEGLGTAAMSPRLDARSQVHAQLCLSSPGDT